MEFTINKAQKVISMLNNFFIFHFIFFIASIQIIEIEILKMF